MCSDHDIEDLLGDQDKRHTSTDGGGEKKNRAECRGTCTGCKTRRARSEAAHSAVASTPAAVQIELTPDHPALSVRSDLRLLQIAGSSPSLKRPSRAPSAQLTRLATSIHNDPISTLAAITLLGSTILVASRLALAARR